MKARLWIGPFTAILLLAPMAYSQETGAMSPDSATAEARRQGRVAMNPNVQSPSQSMSQAIAFERYKELAAEREARKSGLSPSADRSVETLPPAKKTKK